MWPSGSGAVGTGVPSPRSMPSRTPAICKVAAGSTGSEPMYKIGSDSSIPLGALWPPTERVSSAASLPA